MLARPVPFQGSALTRRGASPIVTSLMANFRIKRGVDCLCSCAWADGRPRPLQIFVPCIRGMFVITAVQTAGFQRSSRISMAPWDSVGSRACRRASVGHIGGKGRVSVGSGPSRAPATHSSLHGILNSVHPRHGCEASHVPRSQQVAGIAVEGGVWSRVRQQGHDGLAHRLQGRRSRR